MILQNFQVKNNFIAPMFSWNPLLNYLSEQQAGGKPSALKWTMEDESRQ